MNYEEGEMGAYLYGQAVALSGGIGGLQQPNRYDNKAGQLYGKTFEYLLLNAPKYEA